MTYARWRSNVQCVFKMENRALSGAAKRKQRKEKEAKDVSLLQQIPSISSFFTRKVRQGDGTDSSGVSTTTAADNASTSITTAGSSLAVAAVGKIEDVTYLSCIRMILCYNIPCVWGEA